MDILVRVKAIGKRKDILAPTAYSLPDSVATLRDLITALVQVEVARYNTRDAEMPLIPFLAQPELDAQVQSGKVSFGAIYSSQKADPEKAVANAIQCWEDGLVRVFVEDEELCQLDAPLCIAENAVFTFIRLSFLNGSMW